MWSADILVLLSCGKVDTIRPTSVRVQMAVPDVCFAVLVHP